MTLPRLTATLAAASLLSALASCHAPIHTAALGIAVLWGGFAALAAVVSTVGMKRYEVQIGAELGSEVLFIEATSAQEAAAAAATRPIWDEPGVFTVVVFDESDAKTTWKLRIPSGEVWRHNE